MKKPNYYAWLMRKFVLLGYWHQVNEIEQGFEMLIGSVGMDEGTMRTFGYSILHEDGENIYKYACKIFYNTEKFPVYNKVDEDNYLLSF